MLNRDRTPLLVYNSRHAAPYPVFAAHVRGSEDGRPDSIQAVVTVNGVVYRGPKVRGWASDSTRRMAVGFDAGALATGVYPYRMEVTGYWNGSYSELLYVRQGNVAVVNRRGSALGAGWWLSGLEQLVHLPESARLWVGGDGSTRVYTQVTGSTTLWTGPAYDGADTLKLVGTEYVRSVAGGVKVVFNGAGQHVRTENAVGHRTTFTWDAQGRLDLITLPAGGQTYDFRYDARPYAAAGMLSAVVAPGPTALADSARVVHFGISGRQVQQIFDPDYAVNLPATSIPSQSRPHVYFNSDGFNRLSTRIGQTRTTESRFSWDAANRLTAVRTPLNAADTAVHTFRAAEAQGLASAVAEADVFTRLDGPRTDVADETRWYQDAWGAPVRVVNALGHETLLRRGQTRLPGLVTLVRQPNGRELTATYDEQGRMVSTTDWGTSSGGRYATTVYEWDNRWDRTTRVTTPEGEATLTAYDAWARPLWTQQGLSATRRVSFDYYPLADAQAPGLMRGITAPPAGGLAAATELMFYDARGNLRATRTPLGNETTLESDHLGRATHTRTPITGGTYQEVTTRYDVVGRVTHTESWGPAMSGVGPQRLVVDSEYDLEGRTLAVHRRSEGNEAGVGTVTNRYAYDLGGRRVAEAAPDGMRDSTVYDRAGNAVRVRTRRWAESRPLVAADSLAEIRMQYDALNRLTRRITPPVRYAARTEGIATDVLRGNDPYPYYPNDGGTGLRIAGDTVRLLYDAVGNLTHADNHDAWIRRAYYPGGQLRSETLKVRTVAELAAGGDSTSHVYVTQYTYDLNGRRTEMQHPQQLAPRQAGTVRDRTHYAYDPAWGTLAQVTDPLGNVFRYHYDARAQQDSLVLPGGIAETFGYDQDGRAVLHRTFNGAPSTLTFRYPGQWIRHDSLAYDGRGKMTFSANRYGLRDTATIAYTGLGQLASSRHSHRGYQLDTDQNARFEQTEMPLHDALGNIFRNWRSGELEIFAEEFLDAGQSRTNWENTVWAYQPGTGRLLVREDATMRDATQYDAAGNIVFSSQRTKNTTSTNYDRAQFYDAEGRLRVAESRRVENPGARQAPYYLVFDQYRYDALGRRVWVHTFKNCVDAGDPRRCSVGTLRRTVWDGDAELYEIAVPVSSDNTLVNLFFSTAEVESDTGWVRQLGRWDGYDPHPNYGRVAYTYGHAIDKPLGVIRMNYADHAIGASYMKWTEPFAIVPHWNLRGRAQTGTFASGERRRCTDTAGTRCVALDWAEGWFPYGLAPPIPEHWHGTLLTEKRDASGLLYRRNRYYDPSTSRFTQEDPIGLAGGLNAYGYAEGDPVSYSDPYGLYIIIHGDPAYRRRMLAALEYIALRSETFREVYNALVVSKKVAVNIGPGFTMNCAVSLRGACTGKTSPWADNTFSRVPATGDALDEGFVAAHEIFHAAAMLRRYVETDVEPVCGNTYDKTGAMEDCADDLEARTRNEVRESEEQSARRGGSKDP